MVHLGKEAHAKPYSTPCPLSNFQVQFFDGNFCPLSLRQLHTPNITKSTRERD